MEANQLLKIENTSNEADKMIGFLKSEIKELKQMVFNKHINKKLQSAKEENEVLKKEIELLKNQLLTLQAANGRKQVPLPEEEVKALNNKQIIKTEATDLNIKQEKQDIPQNNLKDKKEKVPKINKKEVNTSEEPPIDVGRLDFRVGYIIEAKKHPDADSLYVEQVDVGESSPRTVVSGLVNYVPLEQFQNRLVVVLNNLKPVKMRGILSQAMVMCASTPQAVEPLSPPEGSVPGDIITVEGYNRNPDPVLNPKKKIFETVAPDLKTNAEGVATYKGVEWRVKDKGVVRAKTLTGVAIK